MIECEVDVVEWISNLVRDCCCKAADDGSFFGQMKLRFKLASAGELASHFIKRAGECSHLVEPRYWNLHVEVATGDFPSSGRQFFYRASEAPDEEARDERSDKQYSEGVERRTRRLSLEDIGQRVGRVEYDDDKASSFVRLHRKIESAGLAEVYVG